MPNAITLRTAITLGDVVARAPLRLLLVPLNPFLRPAEPAGLALVGVLALAALAAAHGLFRAPAAGAVKLHIVIAAPSTAGANAHFHF